MSLKAIQPCCSNTESALYFYIICHIVGVIKIYIYSNDVVIYISALVV